MLSKAYQSLSTLFFSLALVTAYLGLAPSAAHGQAYYYYYTASTCSGNCPAKDDDGTCHESSKCTGKNCRCNLTSGGKCVCI